MRRILMLAALGWTLMGAAARGQATAAAGGGAPKILWQAELKETSERQFCVGFGMIARGGKDGSVTLMDAGTGKVRWKVNRDGGGKVVEALALGESAVFAEEYVPEKGATATVALDLAAGTEKWHKADGSDWRLEANGSQVISGGNVRNSETGESLWTTDKFGNISSYGDEYIACRVNRLTWLGRDGVARVQAMMDMLPVPGSNAYRDGDLMRGTPDTTVSAPVVLGDVAYVVSLRRRSSSGAATTSAPTPDVPYLTAFDVKVQKTLWSKPLGVNMAVSGMKYAAEAGLIVLANEGLMAGFEPREGKMLWQFQKPGLKARPPSAAVVDTGGSITPAFRYRDAFTAPVLMEKWVLVGYQDGLLAVDRVTGKLAWKFETGMPLCDPAVFEGKILIATKGCNLEPWEGPEGIFALGGGK